MLHDCISLCLGQCVAQLFAKILVINAASIVRILFGLEIWLWYMVLPGACNLNVLE